MAKNKKQPVAKTVEPTCCQPTSIGTKIMYGMMAVLTVLSVFLTFKVISLEKKINSGAVAGTQEESKLTVDKLKDYAKELGLNRSKFNKCLDSNEKKTSVDADVAYGGSVGVQGTPGFFVNGRFLGGAFPFEFFKEIIDKELDGSATGACTDYTAELQKYCSDPAQQAFFPEAKDMKVGNSPMTGNANAKVTLVEFSDFECPYCGRGYTTVKQILKAYPNDVKFYFKQFPLTSIHANAQKAAEASLCALDQGKFWEYHDKLFSLQAQQ